MIDDHTHHYQQGSGLFSNIISKLTSKAVEDVGKKIVTNAVDQGAKKVGEYLADKATKITKGLLIKTLKEETSPAANSIDFVNEILSV